MIAVVAGRRIDPENADVIRFPLSRTTSVERKLYDMFVSHGVSMLVSSAACGADLLAIEVARARAIEFRIVLPYDEDAFRETSVIDRPGNWGESFDRALSLARSRNDVVVINTAQDDAAYYRTNVVLLDEGARLASASNNDDCIAVVVWEGSKRGADDVTGHFLDQALLRKLKVLTILTL